MGEFFQQFLNRVNRNYGQVDKNIFGGLLPGGAATPIGAALQGYKTPKGEPKLSSTKRKFASILDAATDVVAGSQPLVERVVKTSPEPIQNAITTGLNALPFSVNLFGRYYTGLEDKNLKIPSSITTGIKPILDESVASTAQQIKEQESIVNFATNMLQKARQGTLPVLPGFSVNTQLLNDELAQQSSKLNRLKKGDIPFNAYFNSDKNPLTSPSTSLGNVWFSPTKKGYAAKEKYDFLYSGEDKRIQFPIPGAQLNPSQQMLLSAVDSTQIPTQFRGPTSSPITNIGRAIVSKMSPKDFEYLINIR